MASIEAHARIKELEEEIKRLRAEFNTRETIDVKRIEELAMKGDTAKRMYGERYGVGEDDIRNGISKIVRAIIKNGHKTDEKGNFTSKLKMFRDMDQEQLRVVRKCSDEIIAVLEKYVGLERIEG